jgi:Na+/melibiose symporter-like transporter
LINPIDVAAFFTFPVITLLPLLIIPKLNMVSEQIQPYHFRTQLPSQRFAPSLINPIDVAAFFTFPVITLLWHQDCHIQFPRTVVFFCVLSWIMLVHICHDDYY